LLTIRTDFSLLFVFVVFNLPHPHLYPPPPRGRGRIKEDFLNFLPLPKGGGGLRRRRNSFYCKRYCKQCDETVQL